MASDGLSLRKSRTWPHLMFVLNCLAANGIYRLGHRINGASYSAIAIKLRRHRSSFTEYGRWHVSFYFGVERNVTRVDKTVGKHVYGRKYELPYIVIMSF